MEKWYSQKALYFKLIYALALSFFIQFAAMFLNAQDPFAYFAIMFTVFALLYSLPFMVTMFLLIKSISKKEKKQVKKFLLPDFLYIVLPSAVGTVLSEVIFSMFDKNARQGAGFFSLTMIVLFIFLLLFFWLVYVIIIKIKYIFPRLNNRP